MKEELKKTAIEELKAAELLIINNMHKSATILLSKALFALLDYIIYSKYEKLPKNHSERFRILQIKEPKLYNIVDDIWNKYTDTYSKPSTKESIELLKGAIKEVTKDETTGAEFKESLGEK